MLFAFRVLSVFLISLLLLAPLLKSVNKRPEKPLVLILQDNSSSIAKSPHKDFDPKAFVAQLSKLKQTLGNDYEVREFHFSTGLNNGLSVDFTGKQTAISNALKALSNRFAQQPISALILATDGIYNQGSTPIQEAEKLNTNIFTIALGDTMAKRDLLIANVNYNKTASLGNDFLIEVFIQAYHAKGESLQLDVKEEGRKVFSQKITLNSNNFHKTIPVKLRANKKGIRKYVVELVPVKQENSIENNSETLYVDVLDTHQKILILYDAPHPDISAIRQSLQTNKNYAVKASLLEDFDTSELTAYSLVVLYQLPGNAQQSAAVITKIIQLKIAYWYITGVQTDFQMLNNVQKLAQMSGYSSKMQEVVALPVNAFSAFTLSDSTRLKLAQFPPLLARFGVYSGSGFVLLQQKIGNVATNYPLLTFSEAGGVRSAILTGEGIWRWKLAEYDRYVNHHAVDELFGQSVQYLTAKANRSRFRVYPAKTIFDENESVLINAELYNEANELINLPEARIDLKSKSGKTYNFLFSRNNQAYFLDAGLLPADEYTFIANSITGETKQVATGQIAVKKLDLETRQTAADHQLLYALAKSNHGQMLEPGQINLLAGLIRKSENIKTVVYEDKTYQELIDIKWTFLLILMFLSTEWFLRKRNGAI